jgi:ABC-2 type transport system ATP-binding protein
MNHVPHFGRRFGEDAMLHQDNPPAIEIRGLTKHFGKVIAVDHVNLKVFRGDIFGFLGPNGAGKTTTIRMLAGLVLPTAGDAFILGHSIRDSLPMALRKTGILIETPAFYPHLSGYDNLRFISHLESEATALSIKEALDLVNLSRDACRKYKTYSMGMKRRLDIASILLHDPQVLILDEPTNGLDPIGVQKVRQLLQDLAAEEKTIFLSSHSLGEVEKLCNRAAIIRKGRIAIQDEMINLLQSKSMVKIRFGNTQEAERAFLTIRDSPLVDREGEIFVIDTAKMNVERLLHELAQRNVYPVEISAEYGLEQVFSSVVGENDV